MDYIDFTKYKKIDYPYPHMIIDNIFEKDVFDNLVKEFPDVSDRATIMGGRKKMNTVDGLGWMDNAPTWKSFYSWLNSDSVFHSVINDYDEYLKQWSSVIDNKCSLETNCFTHIDWSSAEDGYNREIHRDTDKRIWNFLIFLSDKDWDGGDFIMHETGDLQSYPHQVFNKELPIYKTVEAKKNMGVFFLSTPDSYHSVSKQYNTKSPRKFIYGSYSYRNGDVFRKRFK